MRWTEEGPSGDDVEVDGVVIRTTRLGSVDAARAAEVAEALADQLGARQIVSTRWSGDTLYLRARQPVTPDDMAPVFASAGLELRPADPAELLDAQTPDEGGTYRARFAAWGLDRDLERLLERSFEGADVHVVNSYSIGPKTSQDLFYKAIKAILYAMAFIMLYLAFRFDIRYSPGAIKATVHDAVIVVGVLAVTWTPVSLGTFAALLTIIGYSTNDTAIVFDRIRENLRVHKDKKLDRVVNISLNEVLGRSLLTTLCVLAVTIPMQLLGDGVLANFAFVLNVGLVVSAASTIFLSAPVFVWISRRWYSGPPRPRGRVAAAEPT
jgi:preprotein translocase subunit SecF